MNSVLPIKIIRQIWLPAIVLALVSILLFISEYQFLIVDQDLSLYGGIIAAIFAIAGIWIGRNFNKFPKISSENSITSDAVPNLSRESFSVESGLSKREFEILELMATGMSNIEISDKLFISVHTVKSHASSLFQKLEVKSRTQAIVKARSVGMIS